MGVSTGAAAVVDVGAGVDSFVGAGAGVMVWTVAHPVPKVSKRATASMPNASGELEFGGIIYGSCDPICVGLILTFCLPPRTIGVYALAQENDDRH